MIDLTFARGPVLASDDRSIAAKRLFFQACDKERVDPLGSTLYVGVSEVNSLVY